MILLVEDEENDAWLFKRAWISVSTAELVWCPTATDALRYLQSSPRPSLIVTDLKLPGTNGFEFLEQLRADPRWCDIPVVVLTSSPVRSDVERAYRIGAASFVVKPVDYVQLKAAVKALNNCLCNPATASYNSIPGWLPLDASHGKDALRPPTV